VLKLLDDNPWMLPVLTVVGVGVTFAVGGVRWAIGGVLVLGVLAMAALLNSLRVSRRCIQTLESELLEQTAATPARTLFVGLTESPARSIADLLTAAERISISGRTALNLFVRYGGAITEAVKRGAEVRVLLVDPGSSATSVLYGRDPATYASNFRSVELKISEVQLATNGATGTFEVRLMDEAPTYGIVIAEKDPREASLAAMQVYFLHTRTGADRPVVVFPAIDPWFKVFISEFNAGWRKASTWTERTTPKAERQDGVNVAHVGEAAGPAQQPESPQ
jgi:hypothetical protein